MNLKLRKEQYSLKYLERAILSMKKRLREYWTKERIDQKAIFDEAYKEYKMMQKAGFYD